MCFANSSFADLSSSSKSCTACSSVSTRGIPQPLKLALVYAISSEQLIKRDGFSPPILPARLFFCCFCNYKPLLFLLYLPLVCGICHAQHLGFIRSYPLYNKPSQLHLVILAQINIHSINQCYMQIIIYNAIHEAWTLQPSL